MLAAVCRACVVSGGSAAMQWTVGGGVYAVCEQKCTMYCGTAGRRTHPAVPQSQADQTSSSRNVCSVAGTPRLV